MVLSIGMGLEFLSSITSVEPKVGRCPVLCRKIQGKNKALICGLAHFHSINTLTVTSFATNVMSLNENLGKNMNNLLLRVNTTPLQNTNEGVIGTQLIRAGDAIAKWLRS